MPSPPYKITLAYTLGTPVKFWKDYEFEYRTVDGKKKKRIIPEGTTAIVQWARKTNHFPIEHKYALDIDGFGLTIDVPDDYIIIVAEL